MLVECSLLFSPDDAAIVGSGCPPWASPRELLRPPLPPLFSCPLFPCDPLEELVLCMFGAASVILSKSYMLEKILMRWIPNNRTWVLRLMRKGVLV
jgi:hypothetical protein